MDNAPKNTAQVKSANPVNIDEFRELAQKALSVDAWNYIAGGSEDETTVSENSLAYRRWRLMPRIFRDVETRDQSVSLLGEKVDLPVILAPTSPLKLAHGDAELAQVRAAARNGALAILSMDAHYNLEETARESKGLRWFQLYCYGDRALMRDVIHKAEASGYKALVVTADAFYPGRRERMLRTSFTLPATIRMGNLEGLQIDPSARRADGSIRRFALTWEDFDWIKQCTKLPIVVKGISSPDDAEMAVRHGASALVVSNHGGRQIDQVVPSLDCLPPIKDQVGDRAEVYVDGGIRRGTDVLKAIALGARAVLIGRAYIWGLAAGGEEGVSRVLEIFRQEIDVAMAQLGHSTLGTIDRSCILPAYPYHQQA